jgi:cell division septum initiation protein DivIVA
MPDTSFADYVVRWEKLLKSLEANQADLPFLADLRSQLVRVVEGLKAATVQQDMFRSQSQQTTRDMEGFLEEGRDFATRLRNGVRAQYGLRGEKLLEFDLQPRRRQLKAKSKPKSKKKKEEEKKKPDPAVQPDPAPEPVTNS